MVGFMTKNANDNEPNPWKSIGWQADLILNRLRCAAQLLNSEEEKEKREGDTDASNGNKKGPQTRS
jgi:hypothetical protein